MLERSIAGRKMLNENANLQQQLRRSFMKKSTRCLRWVRGDGGTKDDSAPWSPATITAGNTPDVISRV